MLLVGAQGILPFRTYFYENYIPAHLQAMDTSEFEYRCDIVRDE